MGALLRGEACHHGVGLPLGRPGQLGLPEWEPCSEGKLVTMEFGPTCAAKVNLHQELLPLVLQYQPPFTPPAPAPEDDDEESGNAWVF